MTQGERIKEIRKKRKLTLEKFGERLGVTKQTISRIENGINNLTEQMAISICREYGINREWLATGEGRMDSQSDSISLDELIKQHDGTELETQIIKTYFELAPDIRKTLVEHFRNSFSSYRKAPESTVIELHGRTDDTGRFLEYFHSASAGTGVFILGNEASEKIAIPDTPENQLADYAIGVDGNSMEPDYHDGDIVLVSQKVELKHGDVGIFVINNKAYIKEYGETELISRNPDADNIRISEYDNIVCMGKVIGKL